MAYIEVWEKDADAAYYWNPVMNERREEKPLKTEISEWILMKCWFLIGNFFGPRVSPVVSGCVHYSSFHRRVWVIDMRKALIS